MIKWWRNLSVIKKLYSVVGLMALLIASELFTLFFAMNTLSSVRAFVAGEGLWTKAQKDAIHSLYQYALSGDENHYTDFKNYLSVPDGDHIARLELMKSNMDLEIVRKGFLKGGNHPNDIDGMIKLLLRFDQNSYIQRAVAAWTQADARLEDLYTTAEHMHATIQKRGRHSPRVAQDLERVSNINTELTVLENQFSSSLGAGSRWLEFLLMTILALTVLSIEGTGIILTYKFSRNLSRSLKELKDTASSVGKGNFTQQAPVHSRDELGQLAEALNKMIRDLKTSIGEKRQAENANQIKTIFLANMSHEIRTPLGVILGFAEILRDPRLSRDEQHKFLNIIEQTGKNLSRIINDILDISKVESGHLELEIGSFFITDLFEELKSALHLKAEQNNNTLKFICDPSSPVHIATDRLRLHQILMNLISNALRFTENGIVSVNYHTDGKSLYFSVLDTGIGLNPEQVTRLFALFSQADQTTTRKYGGTGLGLILSKRLAQSLGGDVVLKETRLGKGSTFVVTVKNQDVATSIPTGKALGENINNAELTGKKILVVDDSSDNQLLLNLFLSKAGVDVDCAKNGEVGVNMALSGNYDLVLMDMQMPILDGYDATSRLRRNGYTKPIVALTANAMKEDWSRSLDAGCNDHLTKPIESIRLINTIARNLRSSL